MRFLCASNLHLGRRVPGIPDHLNLDPERLSTSAVWDTLVETAIRERVDAVLLAGNTIDRENRLFEPLGPIQRGMSALGRSDIPVYAVAGDQDFDTLPRIAGTVAFGEFRILGSDNTGSWSSGTIQNGSGVGSGAVVGSSARSGAAIKRPLHDLPMNAERSEAPVVLIHASLTDGNAPDSRGTLISTAGIEDAPYRIWVLGRERQPDAITIGDSVVIEPGATCPLDASETGPHGAWIIDTEAEGDAASIFVAIAPVQFEDVDIEISPEHSLEQIENAIVGALHNTLADAITSDELGHLVCVPCSVHLTGVTNHHRELPALLADLARTLDIQHQGVAAAITSVEIDTRPAIDLEPLKGRPDPVGELARLLTSLDGEDNDRSAAHDALVQRTLNRLQGVHRSRVFAAVANDPEPDTDLARTILRRESWTVLDALIRQRGVE